MGEFYAQANCRLGRRPDCKACFNAAATARRNAHLDAHREADRARYANNPARRAANIKSAADWYAANRDDALLARKAWYERNHETFNAQRKRERITNGDEVRAKARAYLAENREAVLARRRRYYERNPDAHRAYFLAQYAKNSEDYKRRAANRRALLRERFVEEVFFDDILQRDCGICGICGRPVMDELIEIDHIIPLGADGMRGTHEPSNAQIAHRACNRKKGNKANFTLCDVT